MVWYKAAHPNKYGATKHEYNGRWYHSKMEAAYAMDLDLRLKAHDIASWIPQVKISLDVNGKHVCTYIVDFELTYPDGSIELVEVKGFATETYRLKRKLLEATYLVEHPGVRYLVVT